MPPDNPVAITDDVTNTDALTNTDAVKKTNVVSGNSNPKKGASIKSLFVYDKNDKTFAPFSSLLAQAYYPGSKLVAIKSVQHLSAVLSKYSTIDTLVIFTHSIPGSLLIDGVSKTSKAVNNELAKANVQVTSKIVFEGCTIMQNPVDTCKMIASIADSSVKVIGYSYYTITQIVTFNFTNTTDEDVISDEYKKLDNKYWLPNLPSPANAMGKKIVHGRRWFRDEPDETTPEEKKFRRIESLSSLGKVSISNYHEAENARQSYDSPVISGDIVTVTNVQSVIKGK